MDKVQSKDGAGGKLESITLASEPTVIVAVVKRGQRSGRVGIDLQLTGDETPADLAAINRKLVAAGIPLVITGGFKAVHSRTGLEKDACGSYWWITPTPPHASR